MPGVIELTKVAYQEMILPPPDITQFEATKAPKMASAAPVTEIAHRIMDCRVIAQDKLECREHAYSLTNEADGACALRSTPMITAVYAPLVDGSWIAYVPAEIDRSIHSLTRIGGHWLEAAPAPTMRCLTVR